MNFAISRDSYNPYDFINSSSVSAENPYRTVSGQSSNVTIYQPTNPYQGIPINTDTFSPNSASNPYAFVQNNIVRTTPVAQSIDPYQQILSQNPVVKKGGQEANPFEQVQGSNGNPGASANNPFSTLTGDSNTNTSYLDQYAKVKPADYQVSQLDLDETKTNLENTAIDSLNNESLVSYYKALGGATGYKAKLDEASQKIKNKEYDDNLAKLGFFRDYLYNIELQNSIFDTKLSSGQRRHNYEVFNQALNSTLGTKDADNPLNAEMEKYIIPEMMRLMAQDGIKVMLQNGSDKTAYKGNKTDSNTEFVFQMDNMNWRTQIGDETFTKYAKLAINNAQDPNASHSYTRMYESALVEKRKAFNTELKSLNGKEATMITALKNSSKSDTDKSLINSGINVLDNVLADDLKYGSSQKSLEKVEAILGKNNAVNSLILYLMVNPIEIAASDGTVTKIDATNIFKKDSKTNKYYFDDERVKTELQARLSTLRNEVK